MAIISFYKLITRDNALLFLNAILLLWALADNSYNYYIILRWITFIVSIYIAYKYFKAFYYIPTLIFALIAIIFNPLLPLYFRRSLWTIIDITVCLIMLLPVIHYYYIRRRYWTNITPRTLSEEDYQGTRNRIINTPEKEIKKTFQFLNELPPETIACPYCDKTISTDDRFCRHCGKNFYED